MPKPSASPPTRSETDIAMSKMARGKAERLVLGSSPYGSMVRIIVGVLLFVLVFGSIFFFSRQ